MKLLSKAADGGKNSGVTGYFLIEMKSLFSIVLLHFSEGTREAFHSHAFNAWTLWLKGYVFEWGRVGEFGYVQRFYKAGQLKYTPRSMMHKIEGGKGGAWALSIRGPWVDRWRECRNGRLVTLTHGRKELN